jgi:MFS family permease
VSAEDGVRTQLVLGLMLLTQFLVVVLDTIAAIGLPAIQRDLGFSDGNLQWVLSAYLLGYGGTLMLGGRAADVFGRRRTLVIGLMFFTATSVACGLAPSAATLVAARALQGVGAAFSSSAALSIVTVTFTGAARNRALGIWGLVSGFSASIGVVFGGVITELLGWPWLFLLFAPLAAAAAVGSLVAVPRFAAAPRTAPLDWAGAVTGTAGIALLVLAIVQTHESGVASASTLVPLAAAAILLPAFVLCEWRAPAPLLPLWTLRLRGLVGANVGSAVLGAVLLGVFVMASVYLQEGVGLSPTVTGLALVPMGIVSLLLGVRVGRAVGTLGARIVIAAGLALLAAGSLGLAAGSGEPVLWAFLPASVLFGVGICVSEVATIIGATDDLGDGPHAGLASGLWATSFQLGGAVGIAILGTLMADSSANGDVAGGFAHAAGAGCIIGVLGVVAVWLLLPRRVAVVA